jgi:hypothetical protein
MRHPEVKRHPEMQKTQTNIMKPTVLRVAHTALVWAPPGRPLAEPLCHPEAMRHPETHKKPTP